MSDKKTILIVEDEADLTELMAFQLKARGFEIVTAADGLEGLERLKTISPHLIILDMNMPRMGGIEFYKNICDASANPRYPVFVLTARANMEKLFQEFNVAGFLAKPFRMEDLVAKIEGIIVEERTPAKMPENLAGDKGKGDISVQEELVLKDSILDVDQAAKTEDGPSLERRNPVEKPASPAGFEAKKKILLLEDDDFLAGALTDIFLKYNYATEKIADDGECLEQLGRSRPDLIILKHFVRGTNTEVLAEQIKEKHHFQSIPIIVYDNIGKKTECPGPSGGKETVLVLTAHGKKMLEKVRQLLKS